LKALLLALNPSGNRNLTPLHGPAKQDYIINKYKEPTREAAIFHSSIYDFK